MDKISACCYYSLSMDMNKSTISKHGKEILLSRITACLEKRHDIVFAYLHGSFVTDNHFNDIDIAVYLDHIPCSPVQCEIEIETELCDAVREFPVDARVLNGAPLSFRYNVVRFGLPLLVNDDDARSDFMEAAISGYFDFAPYRRLYLKETLGLAI